MTSKHTNPKDALGTLKAGTTIVPASLLLYASMSFTEGATKYGAFNWRHMGVRASVYVDALRRHLEKWVAGEEFDPETNVPHLASVIACAGIILDAKLHNKLTDDRPDASPELLSLMEGVAAVQNGLKELHASKNPVHYLRDRSTYPTLDKEI